MEGKKFNPYDWIPDQKRLINPLPIKDETISDYPEHDIEVIIKRIEAYQLDLTANYNDWITIGFAISDEFGESGRGYFHQISKFHPGYKSQECDKQYDRCLRQPSNKRISIKTFYYHAKSAGINICVKKVKFNDL